LIVAADKLTIGDRPICGSGGMRFRYEAFACWLATVIWAD
jgi:hypothetical protein